VGSPAKSGVTKVMRLGTLSSRSRLIVASYNIHGCIGTDRKHDTTRIARVIREVGAHVLGVQELHAYGVGPDPIDEVHFLAAVSGFEVVTGTTFVGPRGDYGIALFSRLPVLAVRRIDLHVPPREPRCALDVDVAVGQGALRVITTHLGLAPGERWIQVQRLTEAIVQDPGRPTVVLGDINEWFSLVCTLRQLGRHFGPSSTARTWPSWRPLFALDRIWVHPPLGVGARLTHGAACVGSPAGGRGDRDCTVRHQRSIRRTCWSAVVCGAPGRAAWQFWWLWHEICLHLMLEMGFTAREDSPGRPLAAPSA
jgi:endonuclease/exonuclease/phosphatase family metal-dependent hydrolase